MNIAYFEPLSQAWERMKKALFKPFDIGKWFVVGFTAFLAGLIDGPSGTNLSDDEWGRDFNFDEIYDLPNFIWEWFKDNPGWFMFIVIGLILIIAFIIVLTWLSSRGKFMFLDNVINDRSLVIKPWQQFKTLGNSLFLWRLSYGFICLVIFSLYIGFCVSLVYDMYDAYEPRQMIILTISGLALLLLVLFIAAAYISLFLSDFVVPLMYKNNIKTMQAWGQFMSVFTRNPWYFIVYGLLIILIYILIAICVVIVGFLTCCIGFVFMIIPYISSVIFLPVSYTFRAFSVEFLEQFGPDYKFFPEEKNSPVSNAT